jgi:hypothetical protein
MDNIQIDDAFIREWHPKYDLTENDEPDYNRLVAATAREIASLGTITEKTFLEVMGWKGALRVQRHFRLDQYERLYASAFRRALAVPPHRKLFVLIEPQMKLPGIEAPTGSTILHIMEPNLMPIIDIRTAEVLHAARLISTCRRDLSHYEQFRQAVVGIKRRCPSWTLRQIDRAIFAFHKQSWEPKSGKKTGGCGSRTPKKGDSVEEIRARLLSQTQKEKM